MKDNDHTNSEENDKKTVKLIINKNDSPSQSLHKELQKTINSFSHLRNPLRELQSSMEAIQLSDPFKELRESIKRNDFRNPLSDLTESIKSLNRTNPFIELQDSIKAFHFQDPLKELRESIKTHHLQNPFRELQTSIKNIFCQDQLKDLQELLQPIQMSSSLRELQESMQSVVYRSFYKDSNPVNLFEKAYQEILSKTIIEDGLSDSEVGEAALKVADDLKEETRNIPLSKLSFEFYVMLLISLILFMYSQQLSHESEERIMNKINDSHRILIEKIDEIAQDKSDEAYYVVLRPVNLRAKPSTKNSTIISVLYSNQTTRLIERKGKWIRVEYFNYISGSHETGWCYKKYLKRINEKP